MIVFFWIFLFLNDPRQGIAMAYHNMQDMTMLQSSWYYHWGTSAEYIKDSRYVPMSRCGETVNLPIGYDGFLLVFNEPNNPEPFGCGITPEVGVQRYISLTEQYPRARYVVGGVSAWDSVYSGNWLNTFRNLCKDCKPPYAYHIHGYIEDWITLDHLKWWWRNHIYTLGKVWITETADVIGRPEELRALVAWMKSQPQIERYAVFTNRATGEEPWYPSGWNTQLVDQYGNVTTLGRTLITHNYLLPAIYGAHSAYPAPR